VDKGVLARMKPNVVDTSNRLKLEAKGDPALYDRAMDAHRLAARKVAPARMRDAVDFMWESERISGRAPLMVEKHAADMEAAETGIRAERARLQDQLGLLAREGRTDSADFQRLSAEWSDLTQALRENPQFAFSANDAVSADGALQRTLLAEGVAGQIVRARSIAEAEKVVEAVWTDTSLNLSPSERSQVAGFAKSTLEVRLAQGKALKDRLVAESKAVKAQVELGIGLGGTGAEDMIRALQRSGAYEQANELNTALTIARHKDLNDEQQLAEMQAAFGAGLPAGMRNNNPGNLKFSGRSTSLYGGVTGPSENTDQGDPQIVFESPQAGMNAAADLALRKFNGGRTTVADLISADGGWTPAMILSSVDFPQPLGPMMAEKLPSVSVRSTRSRSPASGSSCDRLRSPRSARADTEWRSWSMRPLGIRGKQHTNRAK
jgi:hypothetical protein